MPVQTAKDWADEVKLFCEGNLKLTEFSYMKLDNTTQSIIHAVGVKEEEEEVPAEVEEVITEEEKEDEVQDQFDLEEEDEDAATHSKRRQPFRSRKTEEAMSYSSNSGDDLEEDPNFKPRAAKKSNTGRGGKKATTTRKSTRKAKST